MANDGDLYGPILLGLILFGIIWAFLWLLVPFLIYAMHENIKRIRVAAEQTAKDMRQIRQIQDADVLDLKKR